MHGDLKMEKWYNNRLMLDISEKGGTIKFGPYWFLKIAGWCRLLNNCLAIGQQQNGHIWLLRVRKRKKYFEIAATFLNSKQENSRAENFNEIKKHKQTHISYWCEAGHFFKYSHSLYFSQKGRNFKIFYTVPYPFIFNPGSDHLAIHPIRDQSCLSTTTT